MQEYFLSVDTDEETHRTLNAELKRIENAEPLIQKRNNLSGMAADFITILQAAAPIVTAVIPLVIELAKRGKVTRIKLDDIEIENPTPAQVAEVWEKHKKGGGHPS